MGRGQGRARALTGAAALLLCGAASPSEFPVRDARWMQSSDLAADLTHQPAECRSSSSNPGLRQLEDMGRVAFHSPLLLGGQAARVGLSCSSCHQNGRSNRHFHFPGLSGDPGTADVTASLMSSHRGDGIFNPKPIPDLAGDPAKLKVARDPQKPDLRNFIHGLITQEFDGPEPPSAVLDGLVAYVRSLSPTACKGPQVTDVRLGPMLDDVETAIRLAKGAYGARDRPAGHLFIAAARSLLGAIDERFQLRGGEPSRALLGDASSDLRAIELANTVTNASFDAWYSRWPARAAALRSAEPRSYFSEAVVRGALKN